MDKLESFVVAKNAGDATFLQFIHDRLRDVHHEPENVDYMWTLRKFIEFFEKHGKELEELVSNKG